MLITEKTPNSNDLVDAGEKYHKAGQLQQAETYYRDALKIDPGHPGALFYLASLAYQDGRSSFATQLTEELLRGDSNDAEAWHLLGQIALKEENFSRANDCFKKALAIQPNYAMAYYSLGNTLYRQGDLNAGLTHLQRATALNPEFVDAHRLSGNIFTAQHKFEEAVKSYQQAIQLNPDFKLAYEGIGGILLFQKRWDEAIAIYKKAISENAGSVQIHVGLGMAYSSKNQEKDAIENFERAISLDPLCFLAHFHLGNTLYKQGLFSKAVASYEEAVALNPQDAHLLKKLAHTLLYNMRDYNKAANIYKQLLILEPNDPIARHHLAACSGEAVPLRAENAYVEHTFDAFAETFEDVLVAKTKYCGPQLMTQAIQRECGAPRKQFAVLDAGCGTGLCGPLAAEYATHLTGVDLSAKMLAKAKLRNVYDVLIKAELTEYLQSKANAFDIILAADTFIYFGALDVLLAAARIAIRDDGYLFFTVEAYIDDGSGNEHESGYCLYPHGRYGHSETYLRHTLQQTGFIIAAMETSFLRYENSRSVQAFVVTCRAISQ